MVTKFNEPLLNLKGDKEISIGLFNSLVRNCSKTYAHYSECDVNTVTLNEILSTYSLDEIKNFRQMGVSRYKELCTLLEKYSKDDKTVPQHVDSSLISLEIISQKINDIKVTPDTVWADLYKQTAKIINEELVKYGIKPIDDYED